MSLTRIMAAAAFVSAGLSLSACGGSAPPKTGYAQQPTSVAPAHGLPATSCLTSACIYVTWWQSSKNGSAYLYAENATGNVPPLETIAGKKAQLTSPNSIAVDNSHNVYVTSHNYFGANPRITVYSAGAYGKVKPGKTIEGSLTGLILPSGVALDSSSNIYVSNGTYGDCPSGCGSVTVYAAGANGNVPPIQAITGPYTGLYSPAAIAVDADQNIYVMNGDCTGIITVYAAGASGNVAPIQTIAGSYTGVSGSCSNGIAVDANKDIYVTSSSGSVFVFAAGSNGNVPPTRTITGPNTGLLYPYGIALDTSDNMYVTESYAEKGGQSILVFASGANGNAPPIQAIVGKKTKLKIQGPFGIAVR